MFGFIRFVLLAIILLAVVLYVRPDLPAQLGIQLPEIAAPAAPPEKTAAPEMNKQPVAAKQTTPVVDTSQTAPSEHSQQTQPAPSEEAVFYTPEAPVQIENNTPVDSTLQTQELPEPVTTESVEAESAPSDENITPPQQITVPIEAPTIQEMEPSQAAIMPATKQTSANNTVQQSVTSGVPISSQTEMLAEPTTSVSQEEQLVMEITEKPVEAASQTPETDTAIEPQVMPADQQEQPNSQQ